MALGALGLRSLTFQLSYTTVRLGFPPIVTPPDVTNPPAGFQYILGADGAPLLGADGARLYGKAS